MSETSTRLNYGKSLQCTGIGIVSEASDNSLARKPHKNGPCAIRQSTNSKEGYDSNGSLSGGQTKHYLLTEEQITVEWLKQGAIVDDISTYGIRG